ncbi:MAG TPA: hypothetical protein GXZ66_11395 [Clostridiaceae bacterium]|jgi:mannosylglycerate hydrolase|nr:hypothetical protein [Clostridiaceae bacterium]
MSTKKIIHIVPSTHWDREWYLPFRRYQIRLVRLIEKVIKLLHDDNYPNYLLDGQSIMLEDYLEIKPEDKNILKELISKGRLVPGPWYTVPDMMIPSGESLVRNLLIGYSVCKEFGGCLKVGYSPDSFGLVSQLPQIYKLFGYKYAMFSRGLRLDSGKDTAEFIWEAPDKSSVYALFEAYSIGVGITIHSVWRSYDRIDMSKEQVINSFKATMAYQDNRYKGRNRLLVVGIDHLEPNDNLTETIATLKEEFKDEYKIKESTLEEFFDSMVEELGEQLETGYGEQRGEYKSHFALGNTLSTRIDIKMLNRMVENKLQYLCEPLHAINPHLDLFDYLDTKPFYENAWKKLVASHAHDSICGCNVDSTNQDVKMRIIHAYQMAREVEKLELYQLGSSIKPKMSDSAIIVYNPLPFVRSERVCGKLIVPCEAQGELLVDEDNNVVKDAIIRRTFLKRRDIETMKKDEYQEVYDDTTRVALEPMTNKDYFTGIEYEFYASDIPACGYKAYYLVDGKKCVNSYVNVPSNSIENKFYHVKANDNGTINITIKRTGRTLNNLHFFEDETDEGDSYTTNPLGDKLFTDKLDAEIKTTVSKHSSSMDIYLSYIKNNEPVHLETTVTLDNYSDTIMFKTRVNNKGWNHRIRAVFDFDEEYKSGFSDTAFDLTERPIYHKSELKSENIMTMPMRNLLYLKGDLSVAVFSRSTHEYEAIRDENSTRVCLTLLRSVDKVYKTDNPTRDETSCGKGVRWLTEDSKQIGEHTFEYGVKFYVNEAGNNDVVNDALCYQIPLTPFGGYTTGSMNSSHSYFSISGAVLSAIYTLDREKKQLMIRVYNMDPTENSCVIKLDKAPVNARKVDFLGNSIGNVRVEGGSILFEIKPGEIANVMIERS